MEPYLGQDWFHGEASGRLQLAAGPRVKQGQTNAHTCPPDPMPLPGNGGLPSAAATVWFETSCSHLHQLYLMFLELCHFDLEPSTAPVPGGPQHYWAQFPGHFPAPHPSHMCLIAQDNSSISWVSKACRSKLHRAQGCRKAGSIPKVTEKRARPGASFRQPLSLLGWPLLVPHVDHIPLSPLLSLHAVEFTPSSRILALHAGPCPFPSPSLSAVAVASDSDSHP